MTIENIKKENIEKLVKEAIAKALDIDIKKIALNSILIDDLGIDSFGAVELVFELKDKSGVEIPQEDFKKIKKVEDIVEFITNHIKTWDKI